MKYIILALLSSFAISTSVFAQFASATGKTLISNQGVGAQIGGEITLNTGYDRLDMHFDASLGRFDDVWIGHGGAEFQLLVIKTEDNQKLKVLYSPYCLAANPIERKFGQEYLSKIGLQYETPEAFMQYSLKPTYIGLNGNKDFYSDLIFTPVSEVTFGAKVTEKVRAALSAEFGNLEGNSYYSIEQSSKIKGTHFEAQAELECRLSDRLFLITQFNHTELALEKTITDDSNRTETVDFNQKLSTVNLGIRIKAF